MYSALAAIVKNIVSLSYRAGGADRFHDALRTRGLVLHFKNYYAPFVSGEDLRYPLDRVRNIPGLRLDLAEQTKFISALNYRDELLVFPDEDPRELQYAYGKGVFGPGDAELLYGIIRYLRPRRLVEVGAGSSTLIAQAAIRKNREEDGGYACSHVCIEPFENPWLEKLGVEVLRRKVEEVPASYFRELRAGDILFVDSSHAVRPQGDVLYEIFDIYGALQSGVYVHVHDIFTPRDYPHEWVVEQRRLWHEQYLLEAFLSFNDRFEVVCALNWLWKDHPQLLVNACPVLTSRVANNPGSFWFRRV